MAVAGQFSFGWIEWSGTPSNSFRLPRHRRNLKGH